MRKLISLGQACDVGFQLRQHSGDNTSHFFDWLSTPVPGLIYLIENDFPPFPPGALVLRNKGTRKSSVTDRRTKIGFAHQFPRKGKVIQEDFLDDYPAFASRVAYLADRFRATVAEHPVQFVRRGISREEALRLEDAMRRRFPSGDMRFLYVNTEADTFETPLGHSVQLPPRVRGFGESLPWAAMLEREGLIDVPFRLASAQVVGWISTGKDHHSIGTLREAWRLNPGNPWFAHELGHGELSRFRFWKAARLARTALAAEPDNLDFLLLRLRADVAGFRIRREAALQETLDALERSAHADLWQLAGELLLALGRHAEVVAHVERGLAHWPYFDALYLLKGRALFAAGRLAEAAAAADVALQLKPGAKSIVELKARILRALGRSDEAYRLVCETLRHRRSYRLQILRARLALDRRGRAVAPRSDTTGSRPAAQSAETRRL